jgi:hypothetical protein
MMANAAPNRTVEQAVQDFYAQRNYGYEGGIYEKYAWIKFGSFSIPIPNVAAKPFERAGFPKAYGAYLSLAKMPYFAREL